MFVHYLQVAVRHLLKHPLNSVIKILGLALGLAGALLVMIVNYSELTWDSFWPEAEQIYLVREKTNASQEQGFQDHLGTPQYANLRAALGGEFWTTQIESNSTPVTWIGGSQQPVVSQKILTVQVAADFTEIFKPKIIAGALSEFDQQPNVAFISRKTAELVFGTESPLGKIVTIPIRQSFEQGVANQMPEPRSVRIIAVVDMDYTRSRIPSGLYFPKVDFPVGPYDKSYMLHPTYIKSKVQLPSEEVTKIVNLAMENALPKDESQRAVYGAVYQLMPIVKQHLNDSYSEGNQQRVIVLTLLGTLILLVAVSNFVNLSLANYVVRQKEIALRRIQGASRWQLFGQYWLEIGVYITLACLVALILCELFLPRVKSDLSIPLVDGVLVELPLALTILGLLLLTSLILAVYPAIYFSRQPAATILRANRSTETTASVYVRKLLLLVQFVSLSSLVVGLASIHNQLRVIDNYQPGYKTKNIVMLLDQSGLQKVDGKIDVIAEQLMQKPGVIAAAPTVSVIPGEYINTEEVSAKINGNILSVKAARDWYMSADYFSAYGIPLLAGSRETLQAGLQSMPDGAFPPSQVVLCRTTAKNLGFKTPEDALGHTVEIFKRPDIGWSLETKVRAVIDDIHLGSHKLTPQPCMYTQLAGGSGLLMFAVNLDHTPSEMDIESIKKIWAEVFGVPPHHWLLSGSIADKYQHERNLQWFIAVFAVVALAIGILGVYGMTALSTQKRAREIALRKLHGASTWQILGHINRDMTRIVLVANLIAWPVAGYLVNRWLENFYQHFSFAVWLPQFCALALAFGLFSVWFTASLHSLAQGRIRPADVLRDAN